MEAGSLGGSLVECAGVNLAGRGTLLLNTCDRLRERIVTCGLIHGLNRSLAFPARWDDGRNLGILAGGFGDRGGRSSIESLVHYGLVNRAVETELLRQAASLVVYISLAVDLLVVDFGL